MTIFLPSNHGSSKSAGGTQVVFPLPGGAVKTREAFFARTRFISLNLSSTGKPDLTIGAMRNSVLPVPIPDIKSGDLGPGDIGAAVRIRATGRAGEAPVVKRKNFTVFGKINVAFETESALHCRSERGHGILRGIDRFAAVGD
jgi:hypothetical protein